MSGGVDSSVAAALLQEKGFEVIGMTMCFLGGGGIAAQENLTEGAGKRPGCCGLQGIEDARRVAYTLGIKHYVVNMQKALDEYVIDDFCQEYLAGRTPNPCIRCNQFVKFGALLKKTLALGAAYLATGHYARIVKAPGARRQAAGYILKKAKDSKKDQSYFLFRLHQDQLKHILFPLGNYTKDKVRKLARRYAPAVAQKLDSQEICFLPDNNYRAFLGRRCAGKISPGPIVDTLGRVVGQHKGIAFYTIGQREGLGIALGHPAYIISIDALANRIVVGTKADAYAQEFIVGLTHFIRAPLKKKVALGVRIRYNHRQALADIEPEGLFLRVKFRLPQFAITPGQSAVFYDKDIVVGGGIIERAVH